MCAGARSQGIASYTEGIQYNYSYYDWFSYTCDVAEGLCWSGQQRVVGVVNKKCWNSY